ncbi:MAG: CPBP family intramembrane metalloprotease, partial [Rhodospirillaceae bacterium]|nr:CPBP family intramembrane metalloprotease [Rhodospirillaceae bacterium]
KQFFILIFAVTWTFWFAAPYLGDPINSDPIFLMFMLAGLFTPFTTALCLIFTSKNDALKSTFSNKLFNIKLIKWKTIPLFLILFPASIIISVLISTLFGYSFDQFTIADEFSFSIGGIPTLLVLLLAACFEELGWRGYAVESLNNKFNYFEATAIFGVLWSLWHLPMFFIPESYQAELLQEDFILVINFFVSIIPLAFIISWFCKKNSGSILGAILIHSIVNLSQEFFLVSPYTKCIQTLILIVIAAIFIIVDRNVFFGDAEKVNIERIKHFSR